MELFSKSATILADVMKPYRAFHERFSTVWKGVLYDWNELPYTDEYLDKLCEEYPQLLDMNVDELKWYLEVMGL